MKSRDVQPELRGFLSTMLQLIPKYDVARVFDDFLTVALAQFLLPAHLNETFGELDGDYHQVLQRYSAAERRILGECVTEFFRVMIRRLVPRPQAEQLVHDVRLGMMACVNAVYTEPSTLLFMDSGGSGKSNGNFYDALGPFYMELTSRYKSSRMGQFFTPDCVCSLMAQMNIGEHTLYDHLGQPYSPNNRRTMNEPCAGSGTMALPVHARQPGCTFFVLQDIDPICCKMAALNALIHGMPCEVQCGNSLVVDDFRFCYRINRWLHSSLAPESQLSMMPHLRTITQEESYMARFWAQRLEEINQQDFPFSLAA